MRTFFTGVVSDAMSQDEWKNLRNDIVEIDQQVLGGHTYEQRFDNQSSTDLFNALATLSSREHETFSSKNFSNNLYN